MVKGLNSTEQAIQVAQALVTHAMAQCYAQDIPIPLELAEIAGQIEALHAAAATGALSSQQHTDAAGLAQDAARVVRAVETQIAGIKLRREIDGRQAAEARYQAALEQFEASYAGFLANTMVTASASIQTQIRAAEQALAEAAASGDPARIRAAEIALQEARLHRVEEAAGKGDAAALKALPRLSEDFQQMQEAHTAIERRVAETQDTGITRPAAGQGAFPGLPDAEQLDALVARLQTDPAVARGHAAADAAIAGSPSSFDQFTLPSKPSGQSKTPAV